MAEFYDEAKDRFEMTQEAEADLRQRMLDDSKFESGEQWPERERNYRERDPSGPRPCLTINKAATHRRAITNSIRQARPQIRVNPVDDRADVKTADMLNGLLRNIQNNSMADLAYDTATEHQVISGLGYIHIATRMLESEQNLQEAVIKPVINPLAVYMDCDVEVMTGEDAEYCHVLESTSRASLKRLHGADIADTAAHWDTMQQTDNERRERVLLSRYWWREKGKKVTELELVTGLRMSEEEYRARYGDDPMRPQIVMEHETKRTETYWQLLHGGGAIGEPTQFPSRFIPYVRVVGEERFIEGKRDLRGLVRDIADPCRMYNYWASVNTEHVSMAPKAPYKAPAEAVENFEDEWASANVSNKSLLRYNHVDSQGNPLPAPERERPASTDPGIVQAMLNSADDIKSASGQFNESMGNASNATSGRAIRARQAEGQVATYHFVDNLSRAMRHCGTILLDIIPRIYDVNRVARLMEEDGEPGFANIDPSMPRAYYQEQDEQGGMREIYNPGVGRYDVVVSTGPSYQTRRQEQAEAMGEIVAQAPQLWQVIGHKLVKAMDWPDADDMAELLKAMLPPELRQIEDARGEGQQEGMAQVQALREQMEAQVQQILEEGQQAMQQAAQDVQQRDMVIADLKRQLQDKQQEFALKAAEIEASVQNEQTRAEAEVAKSVIDAQAQPPAPTEPDEPPAPSLGEGAAMTMLLTQLSARLESIEQAQNANAEAIQAVAEQVQAQSAQSEKARGAVVTFLSSDQSEGALREAVGEALN